LRCIKRRDGIGLDHRGMGKRILVIQGHPDSVHPHFNHALADAYAEGARGAGHTVQRIDVASLDFPMLRSMAEWNAGKVPAALAPAQAAIQSAEHIVFFFPLWLGGMPALLKGFLEQVARPGFAFTPATASSGAVKLLAGRSARVVVTMGMPALVYRWYFRAHSLKALERNILGLLGIAPIRETIIGSVEGMGSEKHGAWLARLGSMGRKAS
jgi:putative NADPH-quinone reductase